MSSYFDYYARTISERANGLKLVGGGTGLGKTSNIPDVVMKALPPDRKGIYVANRLQLLEQMANAMDSEAIIMLPRDFEVVRLTLAQYRSAFDDLISSSIFDAHTEHVDLAKLRQSCRTLDEIFRSAAEGFLPRWQEETADDYARAVLKDFRAVILAAKEKSPRDYKRLLDHAAVQSLFPFIAFQRRPKARLLLVSLQKLFYGFFNGERTLTGTQLKNYVIFADEFDFLENDLINLIVRSPQIDDPFRFVEFFYREMQRHKLQLETYPASASSNIRRRIDEIMDEIEMLHTGGIRYPEINQFISTQDPRDAAIFRTSHTVSSKPLYLCQMERAFDIVFDRNACSQPAFSARKLFTPVSAVSERILTLLKELETEDPATHRGLILDCYRNTTFPIQIAQVSQFPRRRPAQPTRLGALLDSGYSMYDIHYMANPTDPEEVELRNYTIYTTPEKFMATLAEKNLVFALSATADIQRCVNHFNLAWLGAKDGVTVLPPDDFDQQIVAELNAQKAAIRGNRVQVVKLPELDNKKAFEKDLRRFIGAASNLDGFGEDTKEGHLKRRVERFFASLLWASEQPVPEGEIQSHLMFLNTYKQVEFFFSTEGLRQSSLYQITPRLSRVLFNVYEVDFNQQRFLVVFYNADQAKRVRKNAQAEEEFNALFHEGVPVVVVTQYLSAGNGVNLQYRLANGQERDFLNLHLLEIPYYYFSALSKDDTVEERTAKLKENLWYLAKLHAAKYLSETEFKAKLGTLHQPHDWNQAYQHHTRMYADYQLNTIAALIQAMGRIERVWTPIPDQNVVLCREAYHTFQRFLSPEFDGIREVRERMISYNLQCVLTQIAEQIPLQERAIRRNRDTGLAETNSECKEKVGHLLEQFGAIRRGTHTGSLRYVWRRLREAALKHDFADEVLQEYDAVFSSPYLQNGELYLTPEMDVIPAHLAQPDTRFWRLNGVYDLISHNKTIREYFAQRGYELDFSLDGQYGFVPYFYQAVLSGAIGEEAISALLADHGISFEDMPDALFEVADLKIMARPWYIDCKNYSDATLERFSLTSEDEGFYHKLSGEYFRRRAIEKWNQIAEIEGHQACLIYINLATSQDRLLQYYRCNGDQLESVNHFSEAHVIVVQGALNTLNPDEFHEAFLRFLHDLKVNL